MSNKSTAAKVTTNASLTPGQREAIENYRWANRMSVTDVIREAVVLWAADKGIAITEPTDEGGEDAGTDAAATPAPVPTPGKASHKA